MGAQDKNEGLLRCSFCRKSHNDVRKLIAGPDVYICDECVQVCQDIIGDDARFESVGPTQERAAGPAQERAAPGPIDRGIYVACSLCRMPTPVDHALLIEDRGALCPECVAAVQAAAEERSGEAS